MCEASTRISDVLRFLTLLHKKVGQLDPRDVREEADIPQGLDKRLVPRELERIICFERPQYLGLQQPIDWN